MLYKTELRKWEIAGIKPSPFSSKIMCYCTHENNRNDLTIIHSFIHSYAKDSKQPYWLSKPVSSIKKAIILRLQIYI